MKSQKWWRNLKYWCPITHIKIRGGLYVDKILHFHPIRTELVRTRRVPFKTRWRRLEQEDDFARKAGQDECNSVGDDCDDLGKCYQKKCVQEDVFWKDDERQKTKMWEERATRRRRWKPIHTWAKRSRWRCDKNGQDQLDRCWVPMCVWQHPGQF